MHSLSKPSLAEPALSARQERENAYHQDFARRQSQRQLIPVNFDVIEPGPRRRYNAFWSTYDILLSEDLTGQKILVPGCGFGEDVIRLSKLGADVSGFDLSPDILEITRKRVEMFSAGKIDLGQMPCENMKFPDSTFDIVVLIDILHHVDIGATMSEIRRVLKPGGRIVGNELYTHSVLQKNIRETWIVDRFLYPAMRKYIYGNDQPYITEDEHKIDEQEFAEVLKVTSSIHIEYFNSFLGRIIPDGVPPLAKFDRMVTKSIGNAARFTASRVVFDGTVD